MQVGDGDKTSLEDASGVEITEEEDLFLDGQGQMWDRVQLKPDKENKVTMLFQEVG